MDNQIDNIIDEIVNQNKIIRFASELGHTKDNPERYEKIKNILKKLEGITTHDFETSAKSKIVEIYDKINEQTLHWKWNKLSNPQKKDRIDEYLKYTITDDNKKNKAKLLIYNLIDSKKLKKNAITYDSTKSKVTGIFIKEYQNIIGGDSDCDEDTDDDNNCDSS